MVQHEILMVVAAPLLVLGKPLAVWAWTLPPALNQACAGAAGNRILLWAWSILTCAPLAWSLHALAVWAWHISQLFDAALASEGLHTAQHLSFFLSALLFWWAPLGSTSRSKRSAALFYLFTTMVHTTLLGALLTVTPTVWYAAYLDKTQAFGLDPLEDQQLGGLIMWVPGGLAYVVAALAIAWQSLRPKDHHVAVAAPELRS
jgi:putative membrane protein